MDVSFFFSGRFGQVRDSVAEPAPAAVGRPHGQARRAGGAAAGVCVRAYHRCVLAGFFRAYGSYHRETAVLLTLHVIFRLLFSIALMHQAEEQALTIYRGRRYP